MYTAKDMVAFAKWAKNYQSSQDVEKAFIQWKQQNIDPALKRGSVFFQIEEHESEQ